MHNPRETANGDRRSEVWPKPCGAWSAAIRPLLGPSYVVKRTPTRSAWCVSRTLRDCYPANISASAAKTVP